MAHEIIKSFANKVKEKGYSIRVDPYLNNIVISEDDYYHVCIEMTWVFDAPFDYIMEHVKKEI